MLPLYMILSIETCTFEIKTTAMSYIITNTITNEGYITTDIPGITSIIKINKHTITSWFRNNKQHHLSGDFIIIKNPTIIKSNRKFPRKRK